MCQYISADIIIIINVFTHFELHILDVLKIIPKSFLLQFNRPTLNGVNFWLCIIFDTLIK